MRVSFDVDDTLVCGPNVPAEQHLAWWRRWRYPEPLRRGTRALMHELRGAREPRLVELLAKMSRVDLVIVEGYKSEPHRKIEVHRAANGKPLLFPDDAAIVGVVSDVRVETALPAAHLDDIPAIAAMMRRLAISIDEISALAEAEL